MGATTMRELHLKGIDAWLRWIEFPGNAPARVFLHGLGCTGASDFAHVAAHPLLVGGRSVLVDLMGFGFSDRPRQFGYSMREQAAVVATLLDHLGLTGTQLIGHSMGGTIAIVLADARPELVARLVVCEPNLVPGGGPTSRAIARYSEAEFERSGFADLVRVEQRQSPGCALPIRWRCTVARPPWSSSVLQPQQSS